MGAPTKEAVIGTFVNGRNAQDDFLQLKSSMGGNIFAWIDYLGNLQGTFASGLPGGPNQSVQFNNNGVLGGSSEFQWNNSTNTLTMGVPASSLSALLRSYQAGSTQFFEQDIISTTVTNPSTFVNSLYILQQQDQVLAVNIYQDATQQDHPSGVFPLSVVPLITTSYLPGSTMVTGVFSAPRFVGHLDCGTITGYQASLEDNTVACTGNINTLYGYHSEFFTGATVQTAIHFHADEVTGSLNQGSTFNAVYYSGLVTDDGHSYGFYSKSGRNYFGGTGTMATQLINPTVSTSGVTQQNSPALTFTGHLWAGLPSPSDQTISFSIQESGGVLQFTQSSTLSAVLPYSFDNNIAVNGSVQVVHQLIAGSATGNGNALPLNFASVTAGGSTATYNLTTSTSVNAFPGGYITFSGFTNAGNNGRFIIQSVSNTQYVVYNSGAVNETHAATGLNDTAFGNTSFIFAATGSHNFAIQGTTYTPGTVVQEAPGTPIFALSASGDATDAAYLRILSIPGSTISHGLEIGAIIDGSGTSPVTLQLGVFNGVSSAVLSAPLTLTGSTPTGVSGQLSIGTTTATSASAGANGDVPAQVVGYLVLDQGGTKIKIPYYAV